MIFGILYSVHINTCESCAYCKDTNMRTSTDAIVIANWQTFLLRELMHPTHCSGNNFVAISSLSCSDHHCFTNFSSLTYQIFLWCSMRYFFCSQNLCVAGLLHKLLDKVSQRQKYLQFSLPVSSCYSRRESHQRAKDDKQAVPSLSSSCLDKWARVPRFFQKTNCI